MRSASDWGGRTWSLRLRGALDTSDPLEEAQIQQILLQTGVLTVNESEERCEVGSGGG